MNNPIHKIKKFVKGEKPYWYEDTIRGWLTTGLKDKNGREIFEGDKVRIKFYDYTGAISLSTIFFQNGLFTLEKELLKDYLSSDLEIIDD